MSRLMPLSAGLQRLLRRDRFRQWRVQDGPGGSYRLVVGHPVVATVGVAVGLGAILVGTFGVPPYSPLVLVAVLVAPLPLWLRAERRILEAWDEGEAWDEREATAAGDEGESRPRRS